MRVPRLIMRSAFLARRAWLTARKPLTLGVRVLVRDGDGSVLLVRHSYVEGWHMPGGAVDRGESFAAAAVRELREEVGLRARGTPRLLAVYARFGPWGHDHVALFGVDAWEGAVRVDGAEIAEARFFPPDALPEPLSRATRRRLDEHLFGHAVSERW